MYILYIIQYNICIYYILYIIQFIIYSITHRGTTATRNVNALAKNIFSRHLIYITLYTYHTLLEKMDISQTARVFIFLFYTFAVNSSPYLFAPIMICSWLFSRRFCIIIIIIVMPILYYTILKKYYSNIQ